MKHIYISGPMRGHRGYNFPMFFAAERHLRLRFPDADICNPAREDVVRFGLTELLQYDPTGMDAGLKLQNEPDLFTPASLHEALGHDLAYICDLADSVVVLPGWKGSKGAMAEVATANALGLPVIEFSDETHATESEAPVGVTGDLTEVRLTSATGGEKGAKLAAFDQVSPEVELLVAEHFGKGAKKYAAHNFRNGYPWSLSYSALRRHLAQFWMGEEYDVCPPDGHGCQITHPKTGEDTRVKGEHGWTCYNHTGSLHIVAVIWHAMVLTEFFAHQKGYDDRYVYDKQGQ